MDALRRRRPADQQRNDIEATSVHHNHNKNNGDLIQIQTKKRADGRQCSSKTVVILLALISCMIWLRIYFGHFIRDIYDEYTHPPSYYPPSMGFVVVDVRQDGVGELVKPQVERLLELTNNLHVELWVSIAAVKTEDKLFQELNNTGRFHVRMMKESHTYGNSTIDLQGVMGGHVGKAHALKESRFDFPLLLDGNSWPCNDYFVKEVEEMVVNGHTDVIWTLAPIKFGGNGGNATRFVDHRIADEIDVYKSFQERNTGTLIAVKRTSPAVQSWLALTMNIYVQHVDAGINDGNGNQRDQPAFREAFFIHRHKLKEHFATDACRRANGCQCDSCTLVHSKRFFNKCVQDYADGLSSKYLDAYTAKVTTTDTDTTLCHQVLITSSGGVGSSKFMNTFDKIAKERHLKVNDPGDWDGLKHKPATWWKDQSHSSTSLLQTKVGAHDDDYEYVMSCFHKVLVIIGDPLHAIDSTYRRFTAMHINRMKEASGLGTYEEDVTLEEIYNDIVSSGKDQTGIANYVESWHAASKDRSNWPEIKLVTSKNLYDNAAGIAHWLGVTNEDDLDKFSGFRFDTSKRRTAATPPGIPDELREQVVKALENVTAIVEQIEENYVPETISRLPSMRMILFVSTCAMLVFAKASAQWRMQIIHYAVCPVLLFWFILELFKVGILIGAYLQG